MSLKSHNESELPDVQTVIERETYLYGERVSRDPRCNIADMEKVMERVCQIILEGGFGEHMAKTAEPIED